MTNKEIFYAKWRGAANCVADMLTEHLAMSVHVRKKCEELIALVDKMDDDNWESVTEQMREIITNIELRLK